MEAAVTTPLCFVINSPEVCFGTPMPFPLQRTLRVFWTGGGCPTSPGERECWCLLITGNLLVLTYTICEGSWLPMLPSHADHPPEILSSLSPDNYSPPEGPRGASFSLLQCTCAGVMVCLLLSLAGCWKENPVSAFSSNHFLCLQVSLITILNV